VEGKSNPSVVVPDSINIGLFVLKSNLVFGLEWHKEFRQCWGWGSKGLEKTLRIILGQVHYHYGHFLVHGMDDFSIFFR
jgi:hypothetical protein